MPPIGAFHDLGISLRSPFSVPYLLIVSGGQRFLSGSAPIKVIRVRIVALRSGVCAVTGDVPRSPLDIVPSGQSRPSKSLPLPSLQHRRWGTRAYS